MDCTIRLSETRAEAACPPVADRGPDDGACRVPRRRNPPPGGTAGPERPPAEGWDGVHIPTLPRGTPSVEGWGSLRPRPPGPARRSRRGGRGATRSRPATCGVRGSHARAQFPCTSPPMSMCTSRSPTVSITRGSNPGCGDAARNRPSMISSGRADTKWISVSVRWWRRRLRPFSTAPSSMSPRTLSKCSIPRRTVTRVTGAWPGHRAREGFGSHFRATTEAFRGISGPQDRV